MRESVTHPTRRAVVAMVGATAAALAAERSNAAEAAGPTLALGWVKSTSNLLAPTAVGQAGRNGLVIKSANFNNAQDALTAMISGDLQIGLLTPIHLLRAIDGDLDFVQIAGNSRGGTGIVVGNKLGLAENDWTGLKAKAKERRLKVASSRGSINELLAIGAFKANGLSLVKDLELVNIPNFAQHPQALRSGEFDMIVSLEPLATMAVADGSGTLFSHPYGSPAGDLNTNYVVKRSWLKDNADVAKAFVKTLVDARQALSDKHYELATATKLTGLAPDILERALSNTRYELKNGRAETHGLAQLASEVRYTTRDVSGEVDAHLDDTFLQAAGVTG